MEQDNSKILTVSYVLAGVLAATTVDVLFEALAATFGLVASFRSQDLAKHGIPVAVGVITFIVLQTHPKVTAWADEVVREIRKIVWPSRQDTMAMTTVVSIMLLVAGVILGVFDFLSNSVIRTIIN